MAGSGTMMKPNAEVSEDMSAFSTQRSLPSFEDLSEKEEGLESTNYILQAVSHEIRNPLMSIGGFAKRLALSLDPSTEEGKAAQIILRESLRLERILQIMTALKCDAL